MTDGRRSRAHADGRVGAVLAARIAIGFAIAWLSGCGAVRPVTYFQLTVPPEAAPSGSGDPFPVTLIVGSLMTSRMYREDRIVYGNGPQMGTYEFQRWADSPTEMIESILLRRLRASGRYRGVYSQRSTTQGDFALRGRLYDLSELTGPSLRARVTLELEMRDLKTGATVWTHDYTHDEPVDGKDVRAVVTALDRNVQRAMTEIAVSLEQYFSSHDTASPGTSQQPHLPGSASGGMMRGFAKGGP